LIFLFKLNIFYFILFERVYKYGEGDDNSSLEDDFNEWKTGIFDELKKIYPPRARV
jgi:hypothetical protein